MAKWTMFNSDKTNALQLRLDGWVDYNISVAPGEVKSFDFVADKYKVSMRYCGKSDEWDWKINGKKGWIWHC